LNGKLTRISIVTPVHNRRDLTLQCLRSLSDMNSAGIDLQIIVVDDGSTDGTADAVRYEFPEVVILPGDGKLWYAGGTNMGIRTAMESGAEYVLAINDDSVVHPEFLQLMLACARSNPKSVVGALLIPWDRPDRVFQVGARWDTWYGGWRHMQELDAGAVPARAWAVEVLAGNCVLLPAEAIRHVGLMDEFRFPHHFADAEYTVRMRRAGWHLLIEPRARVFCQPNTPLIPMGDLRPAVLLRELFLEPRSPRSLVHQFKTRWHSAPTRGLAVAAFCITLVRLGLHSLGTGGNWPYWPDRSVPDKSV
jgi:GT2 family glycosyltransferase